MLIDFFFHLRAAKLKVSINELLTLLEALKRDVIGPSIDEFYYLSRAALVKDETQFDKFDRAFGEYFRGVTTHLDLAKEIPDEWFRQVLERAFTPEEIAKLHEPPLDHRRNDPWRAVRLRPQCIERRLPALRQRLRACLGSDPAVQPDYATLVDPDTLAELDTPGPRVVALVAARVGTTRLIDNAVIDLR